MNESANNNDLCERCCWGYCIWVSKQVKEEGID
uniref:Uncharacterized protein n=1 Tax=Medicago truncatula TaxID=3880 RepID=I3SMK8_MEDTR|nr:unknown [Medicago truncatula]